VINTPKNAQTGITDSAIKIEDQCADVFQGFSRIHYPLSIARTKRFYLPILIEDWQLRQAEHAPKLFPESFVSGYSPLGQTKPVAHTAKKRYHKRHTQGISLSTHRILSAPIQKFKTLQRPPFSHTAKGRSGIAVRCG